MIFSEFVVVQVPTAYCKSRQAGVFQRFAGIAKEKFIQRNQGSEGAFGESNPDL